MKFITRNDKFYIQQDGKEVEITADILQLQPGDDESKRLLMRILELYAHKSWDKSEIPDEALAYAKSTLIVDDFLNFAKDFFDQQQDKKQARVDLQMFCDDAILTAKAELVDPFIEPYQKNMAGYVIEALPLRFGMFLTELVDEFPSPVNPFEALLRSPLTLDKFYYFLIECGLLTPARELTQLAQGQGQTKAQKAPWSGTLSALIEANLLDSNVAAICRALASQEGGIKVKLNEGSLRDYSIKAKGYMETAKAKLKHLDLLRK